MARKLSLDEARVFTDVMRTREGASDAELLLRHLMEMQDEPLDLVGFWIESPAGELLGS